MRIVLFTKTLRGLTAEQVARKAKGLGFSGLDLAVREGQCCTPANITEALPRAAALWKQMNLSIPMVSLEPAPTDPSSPVIRQIFAACGRAGIPNIKLGYWDWHQGEDYWKKFDQIRKDLDAFQNLGREFGVCSLIHTHSGNYYASNASGAMHLARNVDPKYIGIYLDPAHLALDGEPWPMAMAMAGEYLKAIGIKSSTYERSNDPNGPRFHERFGQLEEGIVEWPAILAQVSARGQDVFFSFHAEYSQKGLLDELLPRVQQDLLYLARIGGSIR
jgi:sugar phosphate isomerase/epimerase